MTGSTAPAARRWFLAALVALLTAWVLAPAAVPIYDGISNPDEPYRYVNPPAGAKTTKQPTVAKVVVPVHNGVSSAQYANSAEQAPQVSLYLPPGALLAPAGVNAVDVSAAPGAPAPPLPADGTIVTNVYRLSATAGGKSVAVGSGKKEPTLQMRAPSAQQPGPVFEHRTAAGWERVQTIRVAQDVYQGQAASLGDWALVQLKDASGSSGGSSGGVKWGLLAIAAVVVLLAAVILMIRMRRTGARE